MLREPRYGLVYYRFPGLAVCHGLSHGIFTRLGGVSPPPFASLNLSRSVGDSPEAVEENHRRVCQALGIQRNVLATSALTHGTRVLAVEDVPESIRLEPGTMDRADALITDIPGVYLTMRFADCVPILLYDPIRGAVGIVHAGWRGTFAGVARAAVQAMVEHYGSRPADLMVGIGPAIGPCCYEVGPEVAEAARRALADVSGLLWAGEGASGSGFPGPLPAPVAQVQVAQARAGQPRLDLWEANRRQLYDLGIRQIEVAGLCTSCHTDEFYSHRAEGGRTGRFGVVIGICGDET